MQDKALSTYAHNVKIISQNGTVTLKGPVRSEDEKQAIEAKTNEVAGGALGWLVGIGALAIPGLGPFIAAGPIMAALAGAGVGGAVGGLTGALIGTGIPEYEAKRYEGRVKAEGILISVHCDSSEWTKRAKEILENTGAEDNFIGSCRLTSEVG